MSDVVGVRAMEGVKRSERLMQMAHVAALPNQLEICKDHPILTFIVPAPNGCNLSCPYCYIHRRNEPATALNLDVDDYVTFIEQVTAAQDVGAICIQGYEPLLPESFEYTRAILEAGKRLGVPTSIVTNGTHLGRWVPDLALLQPKKITVSIDASDPATHDKSRGKIGAFEEAMHGLRLAAADPVLQPVLTLASVLMPQNHERLLGMPALAKELGVEHWVVTILQEVGKEEIGGPVGDRRRIFADLLALKREAELQGVHFVVDDEFGSLSQDDLDRDVVDINALRIRRLAQPAGTFRLLPTGQCSMGLDILKEVGPHTPTWSPRENAYDFIERMRGNRPALAAVS